MSGSHAHRWMTACLLGVAALVATAAPPARAASSYRIEQLYSNLDGSVQYIRLRESAGRDGEQAIGGLTITVTGGGVTKTYTIPRDLWWPTTAGTPVQISTGLTPYVCCSATPFGSEYLALDDGVGTGFALRSYADYPSLPDRFLPVGGGTIRIEGVDVVDFPPLPTNGFQALDRDGRTVRAEVRSFVRTVNPFGVTFPEPQLHEVIPTSVWVREYHHAGLDHYFVTANAAEIDAIERGALTGWALESFGFAVGPFVGTVDIGSLVAQTLHFTGTPVCRYFLPQAHGSTHFYSASGAECAAAAQIPGAILESPATFFVDSANPATGACPGAIPGEDDYLAVYRLWNGRAEANHRYTQNPDVRDKMIAEGWIAEGYGPLGVAFCALESNYYYWDF